MQVNTTQHKMHLSCKDHNPSGRVELFYGLWTCSHNTHKGHPSMGHNEITNRKRFLGAACLENVAAIAAANIQPAQAALFTESRTGELFTRGQMAYVQGFSRMAQSLMGSGEHSVSTSSASSPNDNMLKYLQKLVHRTSVFIITGKREKFVVTLPRLLEWKVMMKTMVIS